MQLPVMLFIRRLMTKQVTIRSGFPEPFITLIRLLTNRQRQRTFRICFLDFFNNLYHPVICIISIFPALKNKRPESKLIAILTTCHNLFFCQTVALCIRITFADSAVITVILTIVGIFDQSSGKYLFPVMNLPNADCFFFQSPDCLRIFCTFYQFDKFRLRKIRIFNESFVNWFHSFHSPCLVFCAFSELF